MRDETLHTTRVSASAPHVTARIACASCSRQVFAKTERGFAFVTFNAAGAAAAAVAGGVTEIGGAAVAVEARVEKVR